MSHVRLLAGTWVLNIMIHALAKIVLCCSHQLSMTKIVKFTPYGKRTEYELDYSGAYYKYNIWRDLGKPGKNFTLLWHEWAVFSFGVCVINCASTFS